MIGIELSGVASVLVAAASLLGAAHMLHAVTGRADPLRGLLRFTALVLIAVGLLGVCLMVLPFSRTARVTSLNDFGPAFFAWLIVMGVWARAAIHYRAAQRRGLFAALSLAAERQMPLAPMALAVADEQEGAFARQARAVASKLEAGHSLSEVISSSQYALPRQAALAAHLGNESGDLAGSFAATTNSPLFDRGLFRPVMLRLIYVLPVMLLFLVFMQIKIGPSMAKIFDDFDMELPGITKVVLGSFPFVLPRLGGGIDPSPNAIALASLGMFALTNLGWLLMLATFCLGVVAWLEWRGTFRPRLPWWKMIVNWLDMAVVLRVMALATQRDRPLPQVLDLVADYYPKQQLRCRMRSVAVDLDKGVAWEQSFRREGLLSANDAAVLAAAERVGNLSWAMREMADSFERRANYRLQALAQVAMPIVLIPAGILVGVMVVAYFAPLTSLIWSLSV